MLSRTVLVCALLAALALPAIADLRVASTPQKAYKVTSNKKAVKFNTGDAKLGTTSIYLEPSTFGWAGLKDQKKKNYDQFLRSNVDNEHDRRNTYTEDGRDHLPFRTLEGATSPLATPQDSKVTTYPAVPGNQKFITATPGQEFVMPLRWNNPHSSELEVNIWIADNKVVVPIRKPACAGEGHQDAAFNFKIPTDWNTELPKKVPAFKGCNKLGDCTVQIYAHSVETRIYSIGIPIVIAGYQAPGNAAQEKIDPVVADPGMDLSKLDHDTCLSSASEDVHITSAAPRHARLVSDQFNHAYQNSNQSPYHGQQQDRISRNLQAAAIAYMTTGDRGSLGRSLLKWAQRDRLKKAQKKREYYVKAYERLATSFQKLIELDEKYAAKTTVGGVQETANCFRCPEVGATNKNRQETTTYIPSWKIPNGLDSKIRALIPAKFQKLIRRGQILIYEAVIEDLKPEMDKLAEVGLYYQQAMVKTTFGTMADDMKFKKEKVNGKSDHGRKAARLAYAKLQNTAGATDELEVEHYDAPEDDVDEDEDVQEADEDDEEPEVMIHGGHVMDNDMPDFPEDDEE